MPQYRHDYGQSEKEWSGDKEQIVKMVATHSRDMQKVSDGGQSPIGRLTHSGRNGSWRNFLEDCRLDRSFTGRAAFSASSRAFDLNGAARTAKTNQSSPIIPPA